jgi:hypothetical protein
MIAPGPDRALPESPVASSYLLLLEGKKFYERLQEIAGFPILPRSLRKGGNNKPESAVL